MKFISLNQFDDSNASNIIVALRKAYTELENYRQQLRILTANKIKIYRKKYFLKINKIREENLLRFVSSYQILHTDLSKQSEARIESIIRLIIQDLFKIYSEELNKGISEIVKEKCNELAYNGSIKIISSIEQFNSYQKLLPEYSVVSDKMVKNDEIVIETNCGSFKYSVSDHLYKAYLSSTSEKQ